METKEFLDLIPDIEGIWRKVKEERIKTSPVHVNRASMLGHPCDRHMVLWRTHWKEAKPHSWEKQAIFDKGREEESIILRELSYGAQRFGGLEIIGQQQSFQYDHDKVSGHVDCFVSKIPGVDAEDPSAIPGEIKGFNPNIYPTINSMEDFTRSKRYWMRRYPAQAMLYAFLSNKPGSVFILADKSNAQIKIIPCPLDFDYVSTLLDQAARVNVWVDIYNEEGKLPDPIQYDKGICGDCPFFETACFPGRDYGDGWEIAENPELDRIIDVMETSREARNAYEASRKEFLSQTRGRHMITDKYVVTGKFSEGERKSWRSKVEVLEGATREERIEELKGEKNDLTI